MIGAQDRPSDLKNDAPLVSIIMLAYNQQDMVSEAMKSLLAQDYPRFELIVSDDCSSDGTFQTMLEIAATYDGPHTLRLNRTTVNSGTLSHLYQAAALTSGQLIVAAGGDDISLPHRVTTLVTAWQQSGADALFSDYLMIDEHGNRFGSKSYSPNDGILAYFPRQYAPSIFGATAAYDRRVFDTIKLPKEPLYFEDFFFSLMIYYTHGKVVGLSDRLVLYRKHHRSLTNSHGSRISVENAELKSLWLARDMSSILRRFRTLVETDAQSEHDVSHVDLKAVRNMERFYEYSSLWDNLGFLNRVRSTSRLRFAGHLRWATPRLLGFRMFMRLKALQQLLRRSR